MSLLDIIKRLNNIPNRCRQYKIIEHSAPYKYKIDVAILREAREKGLSYLKEGENVFYDPCDLLNLSLYLGCSSPVYMQFRCWSSTLRLSQEVHRLSSKISFVPMPSSFSEEKITFDLLLPSGRSRVSGYARVTAKMVNKEMQKTWPEFPFEVKKILKIIEELDYFALPEELRWDLDFIRQTKMADCGGASKLLFETAKNLGIRARHYFGLFISQPYSSGHYCTDIYVKDTWVLADPLLLKLLRYMHRIDASIWTYDRSPGVAVTPLAQISGYREPWGQPILEDFENEPYVLNPIATWRGSEITISLPTEITILT